MVVDENVDKEDNKESNCLYLGKQCTSRFQTLPGNRPIPSFPSSTQTCLNHFSFSGTKNRWWWWSRLWRWCCRRWCTRRLSSVRTREVAETLVFGEQLCGSRGQGAGTWSAFPYIPTWSWNWIKRGKIFSSHLSAVIEQMKTFPCTLHGWKKKRKKINLQISDPSHLSNHIHGFAVKTLSSRIGFGVYKRIIRADAENWICGASNLRQNIPTHVRTYFPLLCIAALSIWAKNK